MTDLEPAHDPSDEYHDVETRPENSQDEVKQDRNRLAVVGIGGSAGSLPALQALFDSLPPDTSMAFVVVTHMDPERESHLPELLQSHTAMPVRQVQGLVTVEPDHVYVVPPNYHISMTDTHLDVQQFDEPRGRRAPIDHFFRSLASARRETIAIILSGGGTDGAVGVKAVKEQGGLLMVQHPDEAEHDSMPRAAINTGLADVVLPVNQLAEKLVAYRRNGVRLPTDPEALTAEELEALYRILTQVQVRTSHDFSQYKRSTILRRIQRRMQLHGYATLDAYLAYLRHDLGEAQALFNDLLIGVTNFFRDREAWEALEENVIPRLFDDKEPDDMVRAWTIGCATGEEAYSAAMLLLEPQSKLNGPVNARPRIQVFASDLDDDALLRAREGFYPEAIEADVTPARLARFFIKEGNYYRVKQELRDTVLFSNHSVLRDPPFSHLDLISCRNLLIYLQRDLQQNVFHIFHYALNPGGDLFLGSSESADAVEDLFHTVDKVRRVYQARPWRGGHRPLPTLPLTVRHPEKRALRPASSRWQESHAEPPVEHRLHTAMVEEFAPPSVLVDETYHVLHVSETAGRYLLHPGGTLTGDLLRLVRTELRYELRTCLFEALEKDRTVISAPVYVQFNGAPRRVFVVVRPRRDDREQQQDLDSRKLNSRLALVFFLEDERTELAAERSPRLAPSGEEGDSGRDELLRQMEAEIQRLRERLQAVTEEYESSHEELKAANEELQSINEEYRSTTEELDTSKEELQSVNEELQTVNTELKNKLEEISRAHSDLENLMATTDVATLFLDRDLHIQRYTASTADLFNIMPGNRGRPLAHLTHALDYDELAQDARGVLRTLAPIEREVRERDGNGWFLARVWPYRTVDDRIDGVVITFVEITRIKDAEQALRATRERYRLVVETTKEYAMFTTSTEGRIESWNEGARRIFGYREHEVLGRSGAIIFTPEDLEAGAFEREMALAREEGQAGNERWHVRKDGSRFWGSGVVTSLLDGERLRGFAKVLRDNTARKEAEEALRQSKEELEALNRTLEQKVEARTRSLRKRTDEVRHLAAQLAMAEQEERGRVAQVLHDDLQQQLYALQLQTVLLKSAHESSDDNSFGNELAQLELKLEKAIHMTRQLNVDLSPPILHDEGLAEAISWLSSQMAEQYGLQVNLQASKSYAIKDQGLRVLLFQAVRELLFNVVKHSGETEAHVGLQDIDGQLQIVVSDAGQGFDLRQLAHSHSSGLATIRRRLRLIGARMSVKSREGHGARVTIVAPLELLKLYVSGDPNGKD